MLLNCVSTETGKGQGGNCQRFWDNRGVGEESIAFFLQARCLKGWLYKWRKIKQNSMALLL